MITVVPQRLDFIDFLQVDENHSSTELMFCKPLTNKAIQPLIVTDSIIEGQDFVTSFVLEG